MNFAAPTVELNFLGERLILQGSCAFLTLLFLALLLLGLEWLLFRTSRIP